MNLSAAGAWPWLTVAALGLFHGINPAMGWLFAVALGLYRHSRGVVLVSLVPIALGHALAVALTLATGLTLGAIVEHTVWSRACGLFLIGWAAWHALRGHRVRARVGMQTGLAGLALWSFIMASAHGAGLMLIPVLAPLCTSAAAVNPAAPETVASLTLMALGVHTAAMLLAIAVISVVVYDRVGLGFLRTGWVNLDLVWTATLLGCGIVQFALS